MVVPEGRDDQEYHALKLAQNYHNNRVACTKAKTDFIVGVAEKAKTYYGMTLDALTP